MSLVYFAVEGEADVPIAEQMIRYVDKEPFRAVVAQGKSNLDPRLPELNRTGGELNWLILRDLDHDAPCAPQLVRRLLPEDAAPRVSLRKSVRAAESWMLADIDGFAQEFSVSRNRLPQNPDDLDNPKMHVLDLCRGSQERKVRQAMLPRPGSGRRVGPEHTARISSFVRRQWDPNRAARRSPSLARSLSRLRQLVETGIWT